MCQHHQWLLLPLIQGSHCFTDKKQDFPGPPWIIFHDVCECFNIKKNGIYLQYSECSPLQKIQHEAKCGRYLFRIYMSLFEGYFSRTFQVLEFSRKNLGLSRRRCGNPGYLLTTLIAQLQYTKIRNVSRIMYKVRTPRNMSVKTSQCYIHIITSQVTPEFTIYIVSTASNCWGIVIILHHSRSQNGLEFEAVSPTLIVGVRSSTTALELDDALTCCRNNFDAQTLQFSGTVLFPSRQRHRLVRWDDNRRKWWLGQLVVAQVRLFALDDCLEQFTARLGARQHVVAGADTSKELGIDYCVALRWNVRHLEIQRLLWMGGGCCWSSTASRWLHCRCLQ